jgi:hypothetical protein
MPTIGAVDVAGAQDTPLQIAELVEHEQRMVAGAAEMPIVGAAPKVGPPLESISSTTTRG